MTIEEIEKKHLAIIKEQDKKHAAQIAEQDVRHSKEIADIRHSIAQLSQDMHNFEIMNRERDKKLDRVLTLLLGDEKDEESGIIHKVKTLMEFMNSLEKTKAHLTGTISAAIAILVFIGGLAGFIYTIFKFFHDLLNR